MTNRSFFENFFLIEQGSCYIKIIQILKVGTLASVLVCPNLCVCPIQRRLRYYDIRFFVIICQFHLILMKLKFLNVFSTNAPGAYHLPGHYRMPHQVRWIIVEAELHQDVHWLNYYFWQTLVDRKQTPIQINHKSYIILMN